jgi:hypothetical protein
MTNERSVLCHVDFCALPQTRPRNEAGIGRPRCRPSENNFWKWNVKLSASSHSRARPGDGQSSAPDRCACRSRDREASENARLYPAKAVSRRKSQRFRRSRPVWGRLADIVLVRRTVSNAPVGRSVAQAVPDAMAELSSSHTRTQSSPPIEPR